MRKPLKIGEKEFKYKKDAIAHYRCILNSYNSGETLNDSDYDDILDLLYYKYLNDITNKENLETDLYKNMEWLKANIDAVIVAKAQFNVKCFKLLYNDGNSGFISFIGIINQKKHTHEELFYIACKNSIKDDIYSVKKKYFVENSVKGQVKCQETGILSEWTELVLDHPTTKYFFSNCG